MFLGTVKKHPVVSPLQILKPSLKLRTLASQPRLLQLLSVLKIKHNIRVLLRCRFYASLSFLTLTCLFLFSPLLSSPQCNNDYAPVCGSNNQNYQNECFLRRDACKQQSEVLIMSEGACPAGMYINIMAPTQVYTQAKHTRTHAQTPATLQTITQRENTGARRTSPAHFFYVSKQDDEQQTYSSDARNVIQFVTLCKRQNNFFTLKYYNYQYM